MKPLDVALLHFRDARDVRSWSGTLHFSKQAMARHVGNVIDLSPAPVSLLPFRAIRKAVRMTSNRDYNYDHDPLLARYCGWVFSRRVARARPDLIFAPAGSAIVPHLRTEAPIVYFTDGPWSVMRDYYPNFTRPLAWTDRSAGELERRTIERSAVVLVSSEWAKEAVLRDYRVDPARVHDVFIGANLPNPPAREHVLPRTIGGRINLLFVGVLWGVKGGEIAYETLLSLLEMGCDAELTVVGCTPPPEFSHPRMRVIPFLNKQVPEELARFEQLWQEAHFFLLPSRCEAAGIVFCEASAHALPILATHTGGIPTLVAEGRNGYTLPHSARGAEYAARIRELASDRAGYERLCETTRDEFEARLNWDAWGSSVARAIATALPHFADRIEARGAGADVPPMNPGAFPG